MHDQSSSQQLEAITNVVTLIVPISIIEKKQQLIVATQGSESKSEER